jgi:hypothetical protein
VNDRGKGGVPVKVWLDDQRESPPGWLHVTTAEDAIIALRTRKVTQISMDCDLGPPENGTGYDVACFIEQESFTMSMPRIIWAVHGDLPGTSLKMITAMEHAEESWAKWDELLRKANQ